jgi:hypothetical protein
MRDIVPLIRSWCSCASRPRQMVDTHGIQTYYAADPADPYTQTLQAPADTSSTEELVRSVSMGAENETCKIPDESR